jgi:SAM-dependent methyltransferase
MDEKIEEAQLKSVEIYIQNGDLAVIDGNLDEAVTWYQKVFDVQPSCLEAIDSLIKSYLHIYFYSVFIGDVKTPLIGNSCSAGILPAYGFTNHIKTLYIGYPMQPEQVKSTLEQTREPQYQNCIDLRDGSGMAQFGLMSNQVWHDDPKRLLFVLARYKFVAKMLSGKRNVLEIGCADAFATRIVQQEVEKITAVDFDPIFVSDARSRMDERWTFDCRVHDLLDAPVEGLFDAAFALDVLEHIEPEQEDKFVTNIVQSLDERGELIVGIPSIQSQAYASPQSKAGHVNCKDARGLKDLLSRYFHHVFIFSMNDEVVHTGFYPMAHYLFALCCSQRKEDLYNS